MKNTPLMILTFDLLSINHIGQLKSVSNLLWTLRGWRVLGLDKMSIVRIKTRVCLRVVEWYHLNCNRKSSWVMTLIMIRLELQNNVIFSHIRNSPTSHQTIDPLVTREVWKQRSPKAIRMASIATIPIVETTRVVITPTPETRSWIKR